jgi:hypothetical protein
MNGKLVSVLAICAAVIVGGLSGVIIMNKREAVARANLARAESEEARAASEAKKARSDESAALANAAEAESSAKASAENRAAKEAAREAEKLALARAKEERAKSEADAEAARERAREASENRAAEKLSADAAIAKAEEAKAVLDAEAARAAAATADRDAENARLEAKKSEEELLRLRQIDFVAIARDLDEYRKELDEREAALRPEKTAADLAWVGEREADVIGGESNRVRRVAKPLPENDMDLPRETRMLARAERLKREEDVLRNSVSSNIVVSVLERLYLQAVREDRVVDAQYYLKNIKMHYPNWRYVKEEGK